MKYDMNKILEAFSSLKKIKKNGRLRLIKGGKK